MFKSIQEMQKGSSLRLKSLKPTFSNIFDMNNVKWNNCAFNVFCVETNSLRIKNPHTF